jgi:hypothetical protein
VPQRSEEFLDLIMKAAVKHGKWFLLNRNCLIPCQALIPKHLLNPDHRIAFQSRFHLESDSSL